MPILYPPPPSASSLNTLMKSLFWGIITSLTLVTVGGVALYQDKNIAAFHSKAASQPSCPKEKSLELLLNEYFEVPMYVYVREGEEKVIRHDTVYTAVPYGDGKEPHKVDVKERETIAYVFDAGTSTIHRFSSYAEHLFHKKGSYVPPGYKANRAEEYLDAFSLEKQLQELAPFQVGNWGQLSEAADFLQKQNCAEPQVFTITPEEIVLDNLDNTLSVFEESSLNFKRRSKRNYPYYKNHRDPLNFTLSAACGNYEGVKVTANYKGFKVDEAIISSTFSATSDEELEKWMSNRRQSFSEFIKQHKNTPIFPLMVPSRNAQYTYQLFQDTTSIQDAIFSFAVHLPYIERSPSGNVQRLFIGFDDQAQQAIFGYTCEEGPPIKAYQILPYSSLSLEFDEERRVKEILSATVYKQSIFLTQRGVHQVKAITIDPTKFGRYTP